MSSKVAYPYDVSKAENDGWTFSYSRAEIDVSLSNCAPVDLFIALCTRGSMGVFSECSRSAVREYSNDLEFKPCFRADYVFERSEPLRFSLCRTSDQTQPTLVEFAICQIDLHILIVANEVTKLPLLSVDGNEAVGVLNIRLRLVPGARTMITGQLKVRKIGKSRKCPFFSIYQGNASKPIYESEVIEDALGECTWQPFTTSLHVLCNGDMDTPVRFKVVNHQDQAVILDYKTSVWAIMKSSGNDIVVSERGKRKRVIAFLGANLTSQASFVDYLRGGLRLDLIAAVDFTMSNADPTDFLSYHYIGDEDPNQYETCMNVIADGLQIYQLDCDIALYGFGGEVNGAVNHCFPLTFDLENPCVSGFTEVINTYRRSLEFVRLSSPTLLAPVIRKARDRCSRAPPGTYTVLLIMTDGVIDDFPETVTEIVSGSHAPLSIIIVGIGDADFTEMDWLDSDNEKLKDVNGTRAVRDIVQFVRFDKLCMNDDISFMEHVLAEVPAQVRDWVALAGISCNM